MSKWTINECIKSQLNVSINNKNPSKDKMEIKLYSSKGVDELDIPEEYKGWVLDETSSRNTNGGRLFITATYKRPTKDITEEEKDKESE